MARRFNCVFTDRITANDRPTRDLTFSPTRWNWTDVGGCDSAEIAVTGPVEILDEALRLVGDRVAIFNENMTAVFWGHVHEVEVAYEGVLTHISLDDLYNRILVSYVYSAADGSAVQGETDWVEHADSIARFGTREKRLNFEGQQTEAELYRDKELTRLARLNPVTRSERGSTPHATLHCLGPWHRLAWQYYTNLAALEEYDNEGAGEQYIGASYATNTISFSAPDDILDSLNGLGAIEDAAEITIAGSTSNNGVFHVDETGAATIEVTETTIVNEAAGDDVVISLGGSKINRIAQSFTLTNNTPDWTVATIAVRAMRVNTPDDNLLCELCADSSGSPGTVLDSATLVGATLPEEMTWVEFTMANTASLTYGTTYWVSIRRDDPATIDHYYIVDVNEEMTYANGSVKVYDGSSWGLRTPDCDMPFRITGKTGTLGQVRAMIEDNDEFGVGSVTVIDQSNVQTWQYREGDNFALDEIQKLLDIGTVDGDKLLVEVLRNRTVVIREQPAASNIDKVVDRFGEVRLATGAMLEPGLTIAGEWINLNIQTLNDALTVRSVFVQDSEYTTSDDRTSFISDGASRAWNLARTKQG